LSKFMRNNKGNSESVGNNGKYNTVVISLGLILALILSAFLFLDWRVKDVCKWSRFEEIPEFSKRMDLISSIFKKDLYHVYFVQDYKDYISKEKLLEDVDINQKEIIKQLKDAGLHDSEITVSSRGKVYTYKKAASKSEKMLFGINGVAIDVKTKDKKLYELLSGSAITISHQHKTDVQISWLIKNQNGHSIHTSSRSIFSFSITQGLLKILDCTRVCIRHNTLIEGRHGKVKPS